MVDSPKVVTVTGVAVGGGNDEEAEASLEPGANSGTVP